MVRETIIVALVLGYLLVLTVIAAPRLEQSEALSHQAVIRAVAPIVIAEPVAEEE